MNYIHYALIACLFGGWSLAFAADDKPPVSPKAQNQVTQLLKSRLGGADIAAIQETPIEGIFQTHFGSKFAYLSSDGRYVILGDLIDLQTQVNLTDISRRGIAKSAIDEFPLDDLVVYPASGKTQAVLNVFTDSSCPYCRKLHEEVPELQGAGIEVRYFPFPRGGNRGPGYEELKKVWCADVRTESMDIIKGVASGDLPSADCAKAGIVDKGYDLGNKIGVAGTPALFTQSGFKIEGYVPYAKLIPMLLNSAN